MDVSLLLQHSQYAVPVGIVLLCAILVFVFGFKKAEQPPFAQLSAGSDVDRKLANKKRGKTREKRSANGQVASEKASPVKKTVSAKTEGTKKNTSKTDDVESKLKERKQEENKSVNKKEKDQVTAKAGKENKVEQTKNKKNLKNLFQEKPVDFDDGDWEQAYSRKDKKNKKKEEESPVKKNKRSSKKVDLINETVAKKEPEKPEIKDKVAKETENKELKEKDKKDVVLIPVSNEEVTKEKELKKEEEQTKIEKAEKVEKLEKVEKVEKLEKVEKAEKAEKVEKEEKKAGKSKKAKKVSEGESTPVSVPSTPKADHKPSEQTLQKKAESEEKIPDNTEEQNSSKVVTQVQEKSGAVFDELGDTWTEAKPQKKSKKKARKDN